MINLKIENIMTKDLIIANINSSIFDIAQTMKAKDIGFIPISDKNTIIGVLTDRDIVVKLIANKDEKIEGYINKNLIIININSSINDVVELMGEKKVKRLLVEKNNKLVGVISLSDILSNLDDDILLKNIRKIFAINRNTDNYLTKINEIEL